MEVTLALIGMAYICTVIGIVHEIDRIVCLEYTYVSTVPTYALK